MPKQYGSFRQKTISVQIKPYQTLAAASLAILLTLFLWLTPSYGAVTAISEDAVQMTATDLRTLITEIQTKRAEASALREALNAERSAYGAYEQSVEKLLAAQEQERQAALDVITQLKRQLNAPALELYTGYNHDDGWEGGVRIVWRLN